MSHYESNPHAHIVTAAAKLARGFIGALLALLAACATKSGQQMIADPTPTQLQDICPGDTIIATLASGESKTLLVNSNVDPLIVGGGDQTIRYGDVTSVTIIKHDDGKQQTDGRWREKAIEILLLPITALVWGSIYLAQVINGGP